MTQRTACQTFFGFSWQALGRNSADLGPPTKQKSNLKATKKLPSWVHSGPCSIWLLSGIFPVGPRWLKRPYLAQSFQYTDDRTPHYYQKMLNLCAFTLHSYSRTFPPPNREIYAELGKIYSLPVDRGILNRVPSCLACPACLVHRVP